MAAKKERIGIVGLGYVGLPLATTFATRFDVVGYDRSAPRVNELLAGRDHTHEVESRLLKNKHLKFTTNPSALRKCTFVIVAVPTPVNLANEPDLEPLESSSRTVGRILTRGMIVVYESTVYPGCTEEICRPILEKESGLKLGDFALGYSPERVNPGDKTHRVSTITKVVSGHDKAALDRVAATYGAVIRAGVHRAPNIKTAEASKVIENVQRDLNIALMNELSRIFARVGINTKDVLDAASTKWNFHRYHPGLVGGHCIGVDPYYLTHLALRLGYHPEVILAGRRINDSMGAYVGDLVIRELSRAGVAINSAHVWILGITFKENVPDFRNTKAIDVVNHLKSYGVRVSVWEPMGTPEHIRQKFGLETLDCDSASGLDAIVLINAHDAFKSLKLPELRRKMRTPVIVDVKNFFPREEAIRAGFTYVSL